MEFVAEISILSKHIVCPSPRTNEEEGDKRIHLTPWDLKMLPLQYIQKGILFPKPHHQPTDIIISNLLTSFYHALNHFYPLAGRLVTTNDDDGSSISISLYCNDEGAEFIHASASHVTISDILAPYYIPPIVYSFFPLNGILDYDGHSQPLLSVQVTELADGIFIACSLNHCVADGTSFWHFFNTWSRICRTGMNAIDKPPVFDRWLPDSCPPPPLWLPFKDHQEFLRRVELPPVRECAFNFSSVDIRKLKAKANEEMGCSSNISSLQSLLAHVWRAVTRARALMPEQETSLFMVIGYRSRLSPPLPESYLGNTVIGFPVKALAGEMESKGLGWTAQLLNQAVVSRSDGAKVSNWFESWIRSPTFTCLDHVSQGGVFLSSSPRFDVYGNDFGWGRPVAVRSGPGNKVNGKVTVYPAAEQGGMSLEICLRAEALSCLVDDKEFMEVVE